MGGNEVNINFGGKKNWALNQNQKGIKFEAFKAQVPSGASKKDSKNIERQNRFNELLFKQLDKNHDNILDEGELQDLQAVMKRIANQRSKGDNTVDYEEMQSLLDSLGSDDPKLKGANRDNLYSFLNTLNNTEGKDNVASATTDATGLTTVVYTDGKTVKYKMEEQADGSFKEIWSQTTTKDSSGKTVTTTYDKGVLTNIEESLNGVTTTIDPKTKKPTKIVDSNSTTTFDYDANPPSATVKQGKNSVTYMLKDDGSVDKSKPLKETTYDAQTQKFNDTTYTYSEDKTSVEVKSEDKTVTTYDITGEGIIDKEHPTKIVTQDGDNTVTINIEYDDDKNVTKRSKTVTDKAGNASGPIEVDENGKPKTKTIDPGNKYWWQIVRDEYGLSGKEMMEVVHVLKDLYPATKNQYNLNISPKQASGGTMELPAQIELKSGKIVSLGGKVETATVQPTVDEDLTVKGAADVVDPDVLNSADELPEFLTNFDSVAYPSTVSSIGVPDMRQMIIIKSDVGPVRTSDGTGVYKYDKDSNTVTIANKDNPEDVSVKFNLDNDGLLVQDFEVYSTQSAGEGKDAFTRIDRFGASKNYLGSTLKYGDFFLNFGNQGTINGITKKTTDTEANTETTITYGSDGKPKEKVVKNLETNAEETFKFDSEANKWVKKTE